MECGRLLTISVITVLILSVRVTGSGDVLVEDFTSANLPTQDSQIVLQERHELEQLVKIDLLMDDLKKLEKSTADVKHLINAYGNTNLQQDTNTMIASMDSLKAQSTHTFAEFSSQSGDGLNKFHSALDHLAHGDPKQSHSEIVQISSIIGKLTSSASALSTKSDSVKQKITGLILEVGATMSAQQQQKEGYQLQERELQAKLVELDQKVKNAAGEAEKAKKEAEAAKNEASRQKKKLKKKKKKFWGLGGVAMKVLDKGFNIELHKKYEKRREQAEKQQRAFEAQAAKQREFARHAESQQADLKVKKKNIELTIGNIATAKDALSTASREITELAAITGDMAVFWETMNQSFQEIAEITVSAENDISKAADGTMKTEILQSHPFQMKAIRFHSKWMAFKLLTSSYLQQMKVPRDEL